MDMLVRTRDGREISRQIDRGPGFPGNELTEKDHEQRFRDCMDFARKPIGARRARKIMSMIDTIAEVEDVRKLVPLLTVEEEAG